MVERLRHAGLVVKRDRPGGRKYVSINRRLPIYRALVNLLLALDRHWPARRVGSYVARWRMPFDTELTDERLDHIFQSPVRSRILLFVAAAGETDMQTMYKMLGIGTVSAMLVVNHWERQGILRSRRFKRHRLVSLNPDFVVAVELHRLLRCIIAETDEYKAFRAIVRAKMRTILRPARR